MIMKTTVVFFCFLCSVAMATRMTPEDSELQKLIWENENVVEGDILVLPTSERLAATTRRFAKWRNNKIYYNIDSSLDGLRTTIEQAIEILQNKTCLKFVESDTRQQRVEMLHDPSFCNSYVGYTGVIQPLRLADWCNNTGPVLHEILHAAGFLHEHMRSDRDTYIKINYQNIRGGKTNRNFKKLDPSENILLNTFDYDSIMLYGPYNGANRPGAKAMESAIPGRTFISPEHKGLSQGDIDMINDFYGCQNP